MRFDLHTGDRFECQLSKNTCNTEYSFPEDHRSLCVLHMSVHTHTHTHTEGSLKLSGLNV